MTESEKITRVQTLLMNDSAATDDVVAQYLDIAKDTVLNRVYPYGDEDDEMPTKYAPIQVELAARYFARRGALGETVHNENSTYRTYGSVDDNDLLAKIVPHAKVVS